MRHSAIFFDSKRARFRWRLWFPGEQGKEVAEVEVVVLHLQDGRVEFDQHCKGQIMVYKQ